MQTPQRLDRFDRPLQQYSPALSPIAPRIDDSRYPLHDINLRLPGIAEDDILYGSLDMSFSRDDVTSLYSNEDHGHRNMNENYKRPSLFPVQEEGSISSATQNHPSVHSQLDFSQKMNNDNNMNVNTVGKNDLRGSGETHLSKESDVGTISTTASRNLFPELNNLDNMNIINNTDNNDMFPRSVQSELSKHINDCSLSAASHYNERNTLSTPIRRSDNISHLGDNTLVSISLLKDEYRNTHDNYSSKKLSGNGEGVNPISSSAMGNKSIFGNENFSKDDNNKQIDTYQTPHKQLPTNRTTNINAHAILNRSSSLLNSAEKRRENRAIIQEIQHKYNKHIHSDYAEEHIDNISEMRRSRELLEATKNYKNYNVRKNIDKIDNKIDTSNSNSAIDIEHNDNNNKSFNKSTQSIAMAVEELLIKNDIFQTDHLSSQNKTPIHNQTISRADVHSSTVTSTPITVPLTSTYPQNNANRNSNNSNNHGFSQSQGQNHSRVNTHGSQLAITLTQPVTSTLPVGGVFCLIMTTDEQPVLVPLHQLSASQKAENMDAPHLDTRDTPLSSTQNNIHNNDNNNNRSHKNSYKRNNSIPYNYRRMRDPLRQSQSFLLRSTKSSLNSAKYIDDYDNNSDSDMRLLHVYRSPYKPSLSERYDKYHHNNNKLHLNNINNHNHTHNSDTEGGKTVHFAASPQKPTRDIDDSNMLLTSMSYFLDEPSLLSHSLDTHYMINITNDSDKSVQEQLVHRLAERRLQHDRSEMRHLRSSLTEPVDTITHREVPQGGDVLSNPYYHRYNHCENFDENVQEHFESQQQQRLRQLFLQHYLPSSTFQTAHVVNSEEPYAPNHISYIRRTNINNDNNVVPIAKVHKPLITHFPLRQSRDNETAPFFLKRHSTNSYGYYNSFYSSTETKEHVPSDAQEMLDVSALSEDNEETKGAQNQEWKHSLAMWRDKLAQTKLTTSLF